LIPVLPSVAKAMISLLLGAWLDRVDGSVFAVV
jgi:hypothetical protein